MEQEKWKNAWIDEGKQLISFSSISGADLFSAREGDFWRQILCWMRLGYRVQ